MESGSPRVSTPASTSWSVCPGCGLALPGEPAAVHEGRASVGCWQLYGEVTGFGLSHLAALGRLHQLTVDTWSAQHPRGATPMSIAFALIGLHLALDEGWRGDEVRAAHQQLAANRRGWPILGPVPGPGAAGLTVFEVALAGSPAEHAELVDAWASAVWRSWAPIHEAVRALLASRLPAAVAGRIHQP